MLLDAANELYKLAFSMFQWAPTLGGECYQRVVQFLRFLLCVVSMGTHPWG